MKRLLILGAALAMFSGCAARPNSGDLINAQVDRARNYQFGPQTTNVSGASNRTLEAAEYRSDIQADTTENLARGQHAELSVVDHKLDTARRAQYYGHRAHMEGNLETKDDFDVFSDSSGSVSNTVSNINSAISGLKDLF